MSVSTSLKPADTPARLRTGRGRILYVTDGLSPWVVGGMQVISRQHVAWLAAAGYELCIIASRAEVPADHDVPASVVNISWPGRSWLSAFDPWRYARDLSRFSLQVSRQADAYAPNAVYAEGPLVDDYLRRPRSERAPVIFHPHGLEMFQKTGSLGYDLRSFPIRGITRRHARRAERTISYGGRLTGLLRDRLGVPAERIATVPNAPPAGFAPADEPRRRHECRFLFVGRNDVRKGLPALLEAMRHAPPAATLDVVGVAGDGGPAAGRVTLHGEVRDRARLRTFFERADFLVVPSLAEGMPTVILEAFAAGLPAIATDVGAVSELVRTGRSGLLLPRPDITILADAIAQACSLDDDQFSGMSAEALRMVREDFSAATVSGRLVQAIDSLVRDQVR